MGFYQMKPYKHQLETLKFLIKHKKAFCCNDSGTGKTLACLLAYKVLRKFEYKKILILCTVSTLYDAWGADFFKVFFGNVKIGFLVGSKEKRLKELDKNYDVYIINHDGIKIMEKELRKWQAEIIIVDEFTAFKNAKSGRWRSLEYICWKSEFIWMLSATPCPQSPFDLYAPCRIVCPDVVPRGMERFRQRLMYKVDMYKWEPREGWEKFFNEIPMIRFSRSECVDLPPVVVSSYHIEMSKLQKDTFAKLRKDAIVFFEENEVTAVNEGVMRTKLLQCCCGYVYSSTDEERQIINLEPASRLKALEELINECANGVIVFATFSSAIDALVTHINKFTTCEKVDGSVSGTKRADIFKRFQNGEFKVIVAHPKTMAHGVTLTYADTIIWYLVTSDAELYEQANARINRIGQDKKMRVIHLLSTELEQMVLDRLQSKMSMQGLLLEFLENER